MARPVRIRVAGGLYHVCARGQDRQALFTDRRDYAHFLELLEEMHERFRVRVYAYCLMRNHHHLLVKTPEGNISRAIQWVNGSYGIWHNRRHARSGHLFGERFKAVLVENEAWGLEVSFYVHLNPVMTEDLRLGKQSRKAQARGWAGPPKKEDVQRQLEVLRRHAWSSYQAYAGYGARPEWLDSGILLRRAGGTEKYRRAVEDRIRQGTEEGFRSRVRWGLVLGGERFARKVRGKVQLCRESAGQKELARRRSFGEIVKIVERLKGEPWLVFRDRYGDWGRDAVLWACRKYGGMTLKELGMAAGGMDYVAVAAAVRRITDRSRSEARVRSVLKRVERQCIM